MNQHAPSSNMLMFQAVMFWIISWWLIDLVDGEPVGTAVAVFCAFIGLGLSMGSVTSGVHRPSPWPSMVGWALWSLRPRKWMIAWACLIGLVLVFGRPMFLWNYGSGRCQYIDWHLDEHVRLAQGDGAFNGCRFLWSR